MCPYNESMAGLINSWNSEMRRIYAPACLHPMSTCVSQTPACPLVPSFHGVNAPRQQRFEPSLGSLSYSTRTYIGCINQHDRKHWNIIDAYPLSKRVCGISFSSTVHFLTLMGAIIGSERGWASSSCTMVSTSAPYTSLAEG